MVLRTPPHSLGVVRPGQPPSAASLRVNPAPVPVQAAGGEAPVQALSWVIPNKRVLELKLQKSEMALLDGEPRSADAIAQEDVRVYWLQREDFAAFLDSHPRAAMTMMASLSQRLRHTTRVVQDATFRGAPARLARVLLDQAERMGRRSQVASALKAG